MSLQPKKGICKICGNDRIVRSRVCQPCAQKRFRSYGIKKDANGKQTGSGEKPVFEKIWNERPHVCESCAKPLGNVAMPTYFSHIIRKGDRQDLKLEPENILLECFKCHHDWQFGIMSNKIKQLSFNKKLKYIKANHNELYQKMLTLIEEQK